MSLIPTTPPAADTGAASSVAPDAVARIAITAAALPMAPVAKPPRVSLDDINAEAQIAASAAAEEQALANVGIVESTLSQRGSEILEGLHGQRLDSAEPAADDRPTATDPGQAPPAAPDPAPAPEASQAKPARRPPLPIVERLKVLEAVRAAPALQPDAELANAISMAMDRAISTQMVRTYRQQLGLPSVAMPTRAELAARLAAAEAALAAQGRLDLPTT